MLHGTAVLHLQDTTGRIVGYIAATELAFISEMCHRRDVGLVKGTVLFLQGVSRMPSPHLRTAVLTHPAGGIVHQSQQLLSISQHHLGKRALRSRPAFLICLSTQHCHTNWLTVSNPTVPSYLLFSVRSHALCSPCLSVVCHSCLFIWWKWLGIVSNKQQSCPSNCDSLVHCALSL